MQEVPPRRPRPLWRRGSLERIGHGREPLGLGDGQKLHFWGVAVACIMGRNIPTGDYVSTREFPARRTWCWSKRGSIGPEGGRGEPAAARPLAECSAVAPRASALECRELNYGGAPEGQAAAGPAGAREQPGCPAPPPARARPPGHFSILHRPLPRAGGVLAMEAAPSSVPTTLGRLETLRHSLLPGWKGEARSLWPWLGRAPADARGASAWPCACQSRGSSAWEQRRSILDALPLPAGACEGWKSRYRSKGAFGARVCCCQNAGA